MQTFAEIFRTVSTKEMEIYIILYFNIADPVKSLRHNRIRCLLRYKSTIIRATCCNKKILRFHQIE